MLQSHSKKTVRIVLQGSAKRAKSENKHSQCTFTIITRYLPRKSRLDFNYGAFSLCRGQNFDTQIELNYNSAELCL